MVEQSRVVDRDSRRRSQRARRVLVRVAERRSFRRFGEVEAAEHGLANGDRHPQQGPHRGMVIGKSDRVRMVAQIVEP